MLPLIIGGAVLFGVIASFVWWLGPPGPTPLPGAPPVLAGNRQVAAAHAKYMNSEGPGKRGPAFEQFVLALDNWRMSGGPTVTEAQMVQLLGTPDLMLRHTEPGIMFEDFAYFYDRVAKKDAVVYFTYTNGVLTVGYNAAWVNAQSHAEMLPYAPPGTTRPTTGEGSSSTQPSTNPAQ